MKEDTYYVMRRELSETSPGIKFGYFHGLIILWVIVGLFLPASTYADAGESVVVVYNTLSPASKEVAEYYAKIRQVPENQILGLELPMKEIMTRAEFRSDLQRPLSKWLEKQKLFTTRLTAAPTTNNQTGPMVWKVIQAKVRYVVLSYDVPLRIAEDAMIEEKLATPPPPQLRKNGAAVDSELMLLPMLDVKLPMTGLIGNPFYAVTNQTVIHPTNGVLMVARLDGPTPAVARALVDKAVEAEVNGLWGRAYFDLRSITNGEYKLGDELIRNASEACRHRGYEVIVDDKPETFPAGFPMSQIAFYFGWYDGNVSGPFTRPTVEFMPGAIAYHLHSFSAATVRSPKQHWVGPLLAKGATATLGCVDEPYLGGTPDIAVLVTRLIYGGFTFGEAACAAQNSLSWQTTIVGDPLYQPFGRSPQQMHADLEAQKSKLVEWSHLAVVNLNLVKNFPTNEVVEYIGQNGTNSAVLMEKLGDLQLEQGKTWAAINAYAQALNLKPSPQQEVRLLLALGHQLEGAKRDQEALDMYKLLVKKMPDYPDLSSVYKRLIAVATRLNKSAEVETFQREAQRLSGK